MLSRTEQIKREEGGGGSSREFKRRLSAPARKTSKAEGETKTSNVAAVVRVKKSSLQMETVTPWGVVLKPVVREEKVGRKSRIGDDLGNVEGLRLEEMAGQPVQLGEYNKEKDDGDGVAIKVKRKKSKMQQQNGDDSKESFSQPQSSRQVITDSKKEKKENEEGQTGTIIPPPPPPASMSLLLSPDDDGHADVSEVKVSFFKQELRHQEKKAHLITLLNVFCALKQQQQTPEPLTACQVETQNTITDADSLSRYTIPLLYLQTRSSLLHI